MPRSIQEILDLNTIMCDFVHDYPNMVCGFLTVCCRGFTGFLLNILHEKAVFSFFMNRHFYTKQRQCIKMLALVSIMYYMLYINRSATQDLKVSPEGPRQDHQVKWRKLIAWLQCSVLQSRHSCELQLTCTINTHTVKDRVYPLMATAFTDGSGAWRTVKKRLMRRPVLQIFQIPIWLSINKMCRKKYNQWPRIHCQHRHGRVVLAHPF